MKGWLRERFSPYEIHFHKLKKTVKKKRTAFQNIRIADTESFGRCLVLDGELQSALSDERIYHEMLVHPGAGFSRKKIRKVLILGGGEGAVLREVLRWKTVEKVTMVDIDREAVEFCRKYLKECHRNSFSDKRAEIIYEDAMKFIDSTAVKWDMIIMDLSCPIKGGPAYKLYTLEFFKKIKKKLVKDGVFATQAGGCSTVNSKLHYALYATLKKVFKNVVSYQIFVPSFDVPWAFLLASSVLVKDRIAVWRKIRKNTRGAFYAVNKGLIESIGKNPQYFEDALKNCRRIITLSKPVYFFK
ncbi:MAG: spermidine synthase [Elusimicrobia bacterium CG08_land_8_20_14_0_20_44_26]|nr:MAG: spermidine synthase [Elusimicrobia bacterium CG08_land_8_20_14_0_20_44_26]